MKVLYIQVHSLISSLKFQLRGLFFHTTHSHLLLESTIVASNDIRCLLHFRKGRSVQVAVCKLMEWLASMILRSGCTVYPRLFSSSFLIIYESGLGSGDPEG